MHEIEERKVIEDLRKVEPVKKEYLSYLANKEFGFGYSWDTFIRLMKTFCSAQSYGARIQNRWKKENDAATVKSADNKGDAKKCGTYYELKSSISSDGKVNIVQIRLHQNVEYKILVFDIRGEKTVCYQFELSHKQMLDEVSKLGTSAHGTLEATKNNETKEYAIRMIIGDGAFKRWVNTYLDKTF